MRKKTIVGISAGALAVLTILLCRERDEIHPKKFQRQKPMHRLRASLGSGNKPGKTHQSRDPRGVLRLEGQVVDAANSGVSRATVAIDANPKRIVTTEEDGSFAFENLCSRNYQIESRKGSLVAGPASWRLTADSDPVILQLTKRNDARIKVIDVLTRRAIVNAKVKLDSMAPVEVLTNQQGKAVISGLPLFSTKIIVLANGYAPSSVSVRSSSKKYAAVERTVELEPGAQVTGRVIDAWGSAVAGAKVIASIDSDSYPSSIISTNADQKGQWELIVGTGAYRFAASNDDFVTGQSERVHLDGRTQRGGIIITLRKGESLAGTVQFQDGRPAVGAAISVEKKSDWRRIRTVKTNDTGRFAIAGLPSSTVAVVASHEATLSTRVEVKLPRKLPLKIKLKSGRSIAGIVIDQNGRPVEHARVQSRFTVAHAFPSWRFNSAGSALSDASGHFALKGLKTGSHWLRVGKANRISYSLSETKKVSVEAGRSDVRLVLGEDGSIKGRVKLSSGKVPKVFHVSSTKGAGGKLRNTKGTFHLTDLPPGRIQLRFSGQDFPPRYKNVVVKPGKVSNVGTIELSEGRTVSGRVLTDAGMPIRGAMVLASQNFNYHGGRLRTESDSRFDSGSRIAWTDSQGSFKLKGLIQFDLVVVADHPTSGRSNLHHVDGGTIDTTIELVMKETGSIEGLVTRKDQPTKARISLSPVGLGRAKYSAISSDDGSFQFRRLAAGRYKLIAELPMRIFPPEAAAPYEGKVLIRPGQNQRDVMLPVGTKLVVHVQRTKAALAKRPRGSFFRDYHMEQVILVVGDVRSRNEDSVWSRIKKSKKKVLKVHNGGVTKLVVVEFHDLCPGRFTVCASSGSWTNCQLVVIRGRSGTQKAAVTLPDRPS